MSKTRMGIIPHLNFNTYNSVGAELQKLENSLEMLEAKIIEIVEVVNELEKRVKAIEKWDSSHS